LRQLLAAGPGWRRLGPPLGAIAAIALAIGIILGTGLSGSSKGAGPAAKSAGATTVQRRDLVETDTESGTLSYASPQTVFNRLTGTITWLPAVGQVIRPGQTLYKVDGNPVVLFDGSVPAYRTLAEGVSAGQDVQELKQNLANLGFNPGTVNQTFDGATASAVDAWQASLGETQTGTVTLGQVVFLPGPRRITAVDTVLGSTGGSGGSGSGSSSSSGSGGAGTSASTTAASPRPEFVSYTTTTPSTDANAAAAAPCPSRPQRKTSTKTCKPRTLTAQQLLAQLVAAMQRLASRGGGATGATRGGAGSGAASGGRSGGGSAGGGSSSGSAGSSGGAGSSSTSAASAAQAILQTTSTQLVVTVNLDATKQTEAVVGEPVTVELPDGTTADGGITQVSPVAQTSSSSSSSGGAGGGASGTPTATVPVTITLRSDRHVSGLDQAAVSVNFEQQKANGVLSVPVTALVATAGGGYAVQEAAPPHHLLAVTPGLFAAGYVQISGADIYPGLTVTDSQG
jgi:hypothetical protein